MSIIESPVAEGENALDAADLSEFGYTQQLRRGLGSYASFAAGFSFVSILTTVFQLFSFGYSFGGPAFFWTWPLVFAGQFLVALCFAELAARYPISGCVYQWSRRMATGLVGHFAGWTMLIGQVVSVSAAAIAILKALAVSGAGGAALLLGALMAAPSLTDGQLATQGLPYVVTSRLGEGLGRVVLVDVAIAICVCTLAIQTAASRLTYSMARDRVLPGAARLSKVSPRTGTPVLPTVLIGVAAILILGVNVGQAQLFTAITSVAVVIVYLAYLLVTLPMLIRRRRGLAPAAPGQFSLGRFGLPVNALAVVYGLFMAVNMAWPRQAVYDPAGGHWYLQHFALLFLAAVAVLGYLTCWLANRSGVAPAVETAEAVA